jgi:hypothetical protein
MKKIKNIRYCSHCGNTAPQRVSYERRYLADYTEENGEIIPLLWGHNFIAICGTCDRILLYADEEYSHEDDPQYNIIKSFVKSKQVWPQSKISNLHSLPKKILDIYEEALKIKLISPNAFVVQIRKALEAICIDQGLLGRETLHQKIKKLTENGRLPQLLSEVTDIIKVIGNAGAHALGFPIYKSHVSVIDDFFKIVLEYLYITPSKLLKFKNESSKFKFKYRSNDLCMKEESE